MVICNSYVAAPAGALIRLGEGQAVGDESGLVLVPGDQNRWDDPWFDDIHICVYIDIYIIYIYIYGTIWM